MKKVWNEPNIMIQQFVPNEYVAACDTVYAFNCNAGNENGKYAIIKEGTGINGKKAEYFTFRDYIFNGNYGVVDKETHLTGTYFYPDTTVEYLPKIDGELISGYYIDNVNTPRNEHISVYVWVASDGQVHCTTDSPTTTKS